MKSSDVIIIRPVFGGMTAITVAPELRPVYIGVTVGAGCADPGKFQILMAAHAGNCFMGPDQGKSGLFMLKRQRLLYGCP
jgi:hypothetical protein